MRTLADKAAAHRAAYAADPDKFKARNRAYYAANRERLIAKEMTRHEANRDEINARRRAARFANPDRFRATDHLGYVRNREVILARQKERRANGGGQAEAYGLSLEQYHAMVAAQRGLCAICGELMKRPCVDHDHSTGAIRGLLCFSCNVSLGHFRDDPIRLRTAAAYVERWRKDAKPIGESVPRPKPKEEAA